MRASHLDGTTILRGEEFHFDVNLFALRERIFPYFISAFALWAQQGLGGERSSVRLIRVEQMDPAGMPLCDVSADTVDLCPSILSLDALPDDVERVRVRFLTPTELKSGERLAARPDFGVLFSRARDRIAVLSALYGEQPLPLDFKAMGERAERVDMVRCEVKQVRVSRISSRTGQSQPLGGFVGEAEYRGELSEFVPFLIAAQFTGVGRQTAWGKGQTSVDY